MQEKVTTAEQDLTEITGMNPMVNDVLTATGFEWLGLEGYYKPVRDLYIVLEQKTPEIKFIIPCTSSLNDSETELNAFVNRFENGEDKLVVFHDRKIEVTFRKTWTLISEQDINEMTEMLEKTDEQFDLIPVCMCCGRADFVHVVEHDKKGMTVCTLCGDKMELQQKQEALTRKHIEEWDDEYRFGVVPKHPIRAAIMAGLFGGLMTCVAGTIMMILYLINLIPLMDKFPWIPGAIGGYLVMNKVREMGHLKMRHRLLIANLVAIATILAVSIPVWLVTKQLFSVLFDYYLSAPRTIFFPSVIELNLFMGLSGFFLSETVTYFWL